MKRGEVWTVSGGPGYADKPRPALIVQGNLYALDQSATICGFTTDPTEARFSRPLIEPTVDNGLAHPSRVMTDKITTVPRARLGKCIGFLSDDDVISVDRALLVFLGLAG